MYLSPKVCNCALCHPTVQLRGFQGGQALHCASVNVLYIILPGDLPPTTERLRRLRCHGRRHGMPGGQQSHRGSRWSQPNARPQARRQFSSLSDFLLSTPLLCCLWSLPLLSIMQQKLFHREGHFQFKGRKSVYSVFGGGMGGGGRRGGVQGEIITQHLSQSLWFCLAA